MKNKTKEQLIKEIRVLQRRVIELEKSESERKQVNEALHDSIQRMEIAYQQATIYARELKGEITERKRAEEALRESEERYRSLTDDVLDSSGVAILILDSDFRVVWVNQALERYFGLRKEEIVGEDKRQLICERIKYVFEDPESFAEKVFATYDNNTYIENFECRVLPDGEREERWLEHWSQPIRSGLYAGGRIEHYTDITERKRAEQALREAKEFSDSLIGWMQDGFSVLDSRGVHIEVNPAFYQMTGFSREELIGVEPPHPYWPPEEYEEIERAFQKTLSGEFDNSELTFMRKNGERFSVIVSPSWIKDRQGNVISYFATVKDITERKRAEEALQESNRQLESRERFITRILESIPTSLVTIDRSLRVVSVNQNFLEKTRRKAQTTLGHKIGDLFPQVLMEYTQMDQKVREVFRTGEPVEGGKVAYRAPGLPTRIYYYRLIPLKVEEMVGNVMLLMDDVTEREQLAEEVRLAERHLASLVECANDLVISMDPQGHIVTWNRAAERTSGLKTEKVKEQPMLSLCATEQRPVMAEMLQRLARGEGVQNTEVNLLTAAGQEVPIAWSCSSMRDDAGKVVGIVAVGRDLTERRQMEGQLIQSAKTASLGVMAGGIAHELRNPLGIISASAQLLLDRPDDAQLRNQCAQKIHAATQRASMIIENLLKFARPQSERMREVDLRAVLEEICTLLAHQMVLQKVTLRKELQPDLPRIYANPDLLQQVFTNLILNARNAMPRGGTLTVTTRATEAGEVEIRFSDTGRGIPSENLSKIFDPFFTTMPVGKGIGLGLSISYSIVQQHQGAIGVESQVGKGTTFTVRLPADGRQPMANGNGR